MKEHKIGEVIDLESCKLQVIKGENKLCQGCYFFKNLTNCSSIICDSKARKDKTSIIYQEIKNMETRNIPLTLDKAKEWYSKGGDLREVALQAYTEDELMWNNFPLTFFDSIKNIKTTSLLKPIPLDREKSIYSLLSLITIRDAWWKIDNGYKPDWGSPSLKHTIEYRENKIVLECKQCSNRILAFRTSEIRDKFYDAFKDLIEKAKEWL